jgi:tRNA 2-thiouridine synthesizing protein C
MKQVVFLVRSAPHGTAAIPESHRSCLGLATLPFEMSYVLEADAVWALLPGQRPEAIGSTDTLELITQLADLDVGLYVDEEALAARGMAAADLGPEFTTVTREQIADFIASADAVLTY